MASTAKKVGKNSFINYLQSSFQELRKVTWPTRNRAIRLTFLVLGFCLVVALILGILDYGFNTGYFQLISLGPDRAVPTIETTSQTPTTNVPITIGEDGTVTADSSPITAEILDPSATDEAASTTDVTAEAAVTPEVPATTETPAETTPAPAVVDDVPPVAATDTN